MIPIDPSVYVIYGMALGSLTIIVGYMLGEEISYKRTVKKQRKPSE